MNRTKMRHQRGRVRPTVRPQELASHPDDRWTWQVKVVTKGPDAYAACAHCDRMRPCPSELYVHTREGHDLIMCGSSTGCLIQEQADYARQREAV